MTYSPTQRNRIQGLTLSELLISLFIFGLLASSLGPMAANMLSSNRMINATNLIINDINLTRSTALNRGSNITMCAATSDGSNCSRVNDWNNGWIVFADSNNNRSVDSGEEILRQQGPLSGKITIRGNLSGNNNSDWVRYTADGSVSFTGRFNICDVNNPNRNRRISIQRVRRPFADPGSATCP